MRNWKARVPIGLALLAFVFGVTWLDAGFEAPWIGPTLAALLGWIALAEFFRMAGSSVLPEVRRVVLGVAIVAAAIPTLLSSLPTPDGLFGRLEASVRHAYWHGPEGGLRVAWIAVACAAGRIVFLRRKTGVLPGDATSLALAALGLALTLVPMTALGGVASIGRGDVKGPWLLVALVLIAKLNDIGGYVFGSLIGGAKLCPGVSPGKTVSGAWGGLFLGVAGAFAAFRFFPTLGGNFADWRVVVFGVGVSAAAQLGDLCESLLKRAFGVKDSAALLPAFGGVFDLVDSFILAGPVGYALLRLPAA